MKKIKHITLLSLAILIGGSLFAQSDLIGYWPFDGNGNELSGSNRNLTLFGPPGFTSGLLGQGLNLDGSGGMYAQRPLDDELYDFGSNDFTVSLWVNFNSIEGEQTMIEKFSDQAGPGWTFTKLSSQTLHFYAAPAVIMYAPQLIFETGVWHNIIICRSSDDFKLYADGTLMMTQTGYGAISNSADPLLVGRRDFADGRVFPLNGMLDEVAIWSKCLTENEITQLWNGGTGTPASVISCSELSASAGADEHLYFGYGPGQCKTKTVGITGGTGPYSYNWTLDRALLLNVVNASGDETMTGVNSASVTVCLLDTAELCITVTDANGCTASDCAMMYGEDVRCFAGNNQKVNVCHNGNTICIDENALEAHLAHGDYVGNCVVNYTVHDVGNNAGYMQGNDLNADFKMYPNPNDGDFIISLDGQGIDAKAGLIQITNRNGQVVKQIRITEQKTVQVELPLTGAYNVQWITPQQVVTKRVMVVQ